MGMHLVGKNRARLCHWNCVEPSSQLTSSHTYYHSPSSHATFLQGEIFSPICYSSYLELIVEKIYLPKGGILFLALDSCCVLHSLIPFVYFKLFLFLFLFCFTYYHPIIFLWLWQDNILGNHFKLIFRLYSSLYSQIGLSLCHMVIHIHIYL